MKPKTYNLRQAAAQLSRIVRDAQTGQTSLLTLRGVPVAALVSVEQWQQRRTEVSSHAGILALRGTGRGLWNTGSETTVSTLRADWQDCVTQDQLVVQKLVDATVLDCK